MEEFHYEYVFDSDHLIEVNTLFSPSLEIALQWFDDTFLQLHADLKTQPDLIRLRKKDSDETIAEFATHFDAVR